MASWQMPFRDSIILPNIVTMARARAMPRARAMAMAMANDAKTTKTDAKTAKNDTKTSVFILMIYLMYWIY